MKLFCNFASAYLINDKLPLMYDFGGVALECSKCCRIDVSRLKTSRAYRKKRFFININVNITLNTFSSGCSFYYSSYLAQEIFKDKVIIIVRRRKLDVL